MKRFELRQIIKEEIDKALNENELYTIYFTTVMNPDSADAEGWTSEGKSEEDAFTNLKTYLKSKGYRGNALIFRQVEIEKAKDKDTKVFTQIQ